MPSDLPLRFGSLFAGIGGMDLGLERSGMECVWQVEIDNYARRVLAKHWPDVRRHDDVKTFPPTAPEDWACDLICGGFPCQDISNAGKRAGIDGARSGLWSEYARIIRVVRPRYVLVENVSALLHRGLGRVLGDLAEIGYDAEWECISASDVGASHRRERLFVYATRGDEMANPKCLRRTAGFGDCLESDGSSLPHWSPDETTGRRGVPGQVDGDGICQGNASDSDRERCEELDIPGFAGQEGWPRRRDHEGLRSHPGRWLPEPDVGRVAHGIPRRVDRLRGLGNAVVPQVAEYIGRMIMAHWEGR